MSSEATKGKQVADEALHIVDNTRHTVYKYPPYRIDDETGTYDLDCCGFVSLVLQRIAPEHYHLIPAVHGWPVPQAFKYYEYFAGLPTVGSVGWRPIGRLTAISEGDVIAWLLGGDSAGDTGHVFVVAGKPEVLEAGLSAVPAYDSSNVLHYDDSRHLTDGKMRTGVGTGTIRFNVDEATGSPTAFQFGPGDHFHSAPIAIGRLERIAPVEGR